MKSMNYHKKLLSSICKFKWKQFHGDCFGCLIITMVINVINPFFKSKKMYSRKENVFLPYILLNINILIIFNFKNYFNILYFIHILIKIFFLKSFLL